MASLAAVGRCSIRLGGRRWLQPARGFHAAARLCVAQNFTMPALSPTMTEGSIAAWRVREGDAFAAGDVLLEIETDKATMNVEAQEDGRVFRITQGDGSKGVPVGARIAVLAEADDDVATLEMPPDEPVAAQPAESAANSGEPEANASAPPPSAPSTSVPAPRPSAAAKPQTYPLYPSVERLIKENGLDPTTTVPQIEPTGPGGRLLKGDVLAFLGRVPPAAPAAVATRSATLEHLDLSNIKIRVPTPKQADTTPAAATTTAKAPFPPTTTVLTLPVSLAAVAEAQGRLQSSLGIFMPVSTFVARATAVANDALPRVGPPPPPSATQLLDELVGSSASRSRPTATMQGRYVPRIATPHSTPAKTPPAADILDILAGKAPATTAAVTGPKRGPVAAPAVTTGINLFSVAVPKTDEKQAQVFLERLKVVLEKEPGRLVL